MQPNASSNTLALQIVQQLQTAGHIAYWAGGCVRDQLMGLEPKDYDVATNARPDQVLKLFPRSRKVGVAFGVVLVRQREAQVEVATFRADGLYSDGRHPDSITFTNAQQDAQRRDFTCNGIFYDPIRNQLHDFVGGQHDIATKTLRAIGNPHQRFAEDHLRMLRAIRFAARLDFQIEPQTRAAITELQNRIELISRERIGEEIRMMLERGGGTRVRAMELLASFPILFAEVLGMPPVGGWRVLAGLPDSASRCESLVAMLMDNGEGGGIGKMPMLRAKLMLSNGETDAIAWLILKLPRIEQWQELTKAELKRIIADPHWPSLEMLYRAKEGGDPENATQLAAFSQRITSLHNEGIAPPPWITGNDLIHLGITPGPRFKQLLHQLYTQQLEGELKSPQEAMAAAKTLIRQE